MNQTDGQPLRPTQFAENRLITAILTESLPVGSALPNERDLARQLGVTRPTLRETLQRLAREGWITIRHGKPTLVNDYWNQGGLGMLATMSRYAEQIPDGFITNLLEVRLTILPVCARGAAEHAAARLMEHLREAPEPRADAGTFVRFDWRLQELFVRECRNRVYPLILNDFEQIYKRLAAGYFSLEIARESSGDYYRGLLAALPDDLDRVETVVRDVMKKSIEIWLNLQPSPAL
ncbi:MAG: GntR family transcriptional regulator [Thermodesulfobacteriota bacterium]